METYQSSTSRSTRREVLRRAGVVAGAAAAVPVLRGGAAVLSVQEATPAAGCPPAGTPAAGTPAAGTPPVASPAAATPGATVCQEHVVEMTDELHFDPHELTIKVGDVVTWTTVGAVPHTSTADPDLSINPDENVQLPEGAETWNSGMVNTGESWSRSFDVPGEYTYFCIPHEALGMVASLTVEE
jgi:plastocyanin